MDNRRALVIVERGDDMNSALTTQKEFNRRMLEIVENTSYDCEERHIKMDELMCWALRSFGCGPGVDLFEAQCKYYV